MNDDVIIFDPLGELLKIVYDIEKMKDEGSNDNV